MKRANPKRYSTYRPTHAVFEQEAERYPHRVYAELAVRRVIDGPDGTETQIEACVGRQRIDHGGQKRRNEQSISLCLEPTDAVDLAIEVAPELGRVLAAARRLLAASREPHRDSSSQAMDEEDQALAELRVAVEQVAT